MRHIPNTGQARRVPGAARWGQSAALVAALCLALIALVAPVAAATTAATAGAIADAIAGQGAVVTGASFVTTTGGSTTPNGISDAPLAGFGTAGNNFGILTTGNVNYIATPTAIANTNNNGLSVGGRGNSVRDVSILKVDLRVPQGANCLTFDFKYLSTEYPGFVSSSFNDAFIAELDSSTWTTSGQTISAPNNFAFDAEGKVVSVNALGIGGFSAAQGAGTPFNGSRTYSEYGFGGSDNVGGATGLLRASTQITPGDHAVYFSLFDQGDGALDSAVFLDNLVVGFVPDPATNCTPGAQPTNYKLALTPATGTAAVGTAHTVTATLTDAAGGPLANEPLSFTVNGANAATGVATTDANGQATFTYTGTVGGDDQLAACYQPGNATACLAQAFAQQTWTAAATTLTVAPAAGVYGGTATLSATLTWGNGPLAGQPVAFTLNGNPAGTATTGADGVATLTPPTSLGTIPVGTYPGAVGATFAATPTYQGSTGAATLTVAPIMRTVTASATGGGTVSPSGASAYPDGSVATYTATPNTGQVFLGWTLDGRDVGFAGTLDFTVRADRTLVARFVARPSFSDVAPAGVRWDAITQLAARGVINGYQADECAARGLAAPCFGPADKLARAQVAALIVRALALDPTPDGPPPFSDLAGVDPELQRAIAILALNGIARGFGDGTFAPAAQVAHAQVISFVARAMIEAGYWTAVTAAEDDGSAYPNVTAESGHRYDLLTFVKYAGALPDRPATQAWADWQAPASRAWTAQVIWQAYSSQFGVDREP